MVLGPTTLPFTFRSLYRLVLRACSSTVLHQPRATDRLRRLYRPVFNGAALKIQRYEAEQDAAKRVDIERWMLVWNQRSA
jgi:hypothetical protein